MSDLAGDLAGAQLFQGLTTEQRAAFAPLARRRRAARGETLFSLGDPASILYVVGEGLVELTMPLAIPGGDREVVVGIVRAGETLAWSALIEPHRFTMSARAGTDVELHGFARADLQAALRTHPEAGLRVLENLAKVVGRRLQVVQTLWTRSLQRSVNETFAMDAHEGVGR